MESPPRHRKRWSPARPPPLARPWLLERAGRSINPLWAGPEAEGEPEGAVLSTAAASGLTHQIYHFCTLQGRGRRLWRETHESLRLMGVPGLCDNKRPEKKQVPVGNDINSRTQHASFAISPLPSVFFLYNAPLLCRHH